MYFAHDYPKLLCHALCYRFRIFISSGVGESFPEFDPQQVMTGTLITVFIMTLRFPGSRNISAPAI